MLYYSRKNGLDIGPSTDNFVDASVFVLLITHGHQMCGNSIDTIYLCLSYLPRPEIVIVTSVNSQYHNISPKYGCTIRLSDCGIPVKSPKVTFVNISQSIPIASTLSVGAKSDYKAKVFAHLATGCGVNAIHSSWWMQIGVFHNRGWARIPRGQRPLWDT